MAFSIPGHQRVKWKGDGSQYVPYALKSAQSFCGDQVSFYGTVMVYSSEKNVYIQTQNYKLQSRKISTI